VRKRITIEQGLKACEIIKRHGIELHTFFMVGFPWETEETLDATIDAIRRTRCDTVSYSIFTPYPGTEAFALCRQLGLVDDDFDVSLYNHQSPANCFCLNIPRERFRKLVSKVERAVDRKQARLRLARAMSIANLRALGGGRMRQKLGRGAHLLRLLVLGR
jgi:hypothetical protein